MTNLAVDLFLSLDVARVCRDIRLDFNEDQARDENGRWTRIGDSMEEAGHHSKKANATKPPPECKVQGLGGAHVDVSQASHKAASSGSAEDHAAVAKLAKSTSEKYQVLAEHHSRVGNAAAATASKRASEDYKVISQEHDKAAKAGGDKKPHVAGREDPAVDTDTANAFKTTGDNPSREDWAKAYPNWENVKKALDDLGNKPERAREAQGWFEDGPKEQKAELKEKAVAAHKQAIEGLQNLVDTLGPNSGRRQHFMKQIPYHEAKLRELTAA